MIFHDTCTWAADILLNICACYSTMTYVQLMNPTCDYADKSDCDIHKDYQNQPHGLYLLDLFSHKTYPH